MRLDGLIFLSGVVEGEKDRLIASEPCCAVLKACTRSRLQLRPTIRSAQSRLVRILCNITDRSEILHFIQALGAHAIMVRRMWVAREVVGSLEEIEGAVRSARGYGIVDVVSPS